MNRRLTIRYVNGKEEQYEFRQAAGDSSAFLRLKEFLKSPTLMIQVENEIRIIPSTSVLSISIAWPKSDAARTLDGAIQCRPL